ncbi:MAG: ATP-binding cassette domain-containing protein [Acidimicrobiia bacterium]|nr:ATP-binding cassette domain-containing protein [Acidimicrobiia bacterium]
MVFEFDNVVMSGANGTRRLSVADLRLSSGGMTAIVGPSGAGKSTLLRLCNRLEVPDRGVIRFHGRSLTDLQVLELRRAVGMVFQEPVRFAGTVFDNLREADPDLDASAAARLLERVGLDPSFVNRTADELSGGEAQRMCIARALATGPEALLMDEPTSSLDPAATRTIEDQAMALAAAGMPILWVTHDTAQMNRIASHVVCLVNGRVAYEGTAAGLMASADPSIAAYLAEQQS